MRPRSLLRDLRGGAGRALAIVMLTLMASGAVAAQAADRAPGAPGAGSGTVAASAADSALDARTRAVASQLRCPVCQGLSLQDSPSELSQQMRDLVRQQLAAGKTPEEVKQYFVDRYGVWILMEPPKQGFSGLVYVIPLVMLLVGAIVILLAVRRWTALREKPAPPSQETPTTSGRDPVAWSVEPAQKPG